MPPFFQPHGGFTGGTEAGYLFHPWVDNDLHAFTGHAGLHGLLCQREVMAEQTLPREGILVTQHHFHHGFVFIVRVVRHADDTQVARIKITLTFIACISGKSSIYPVFHNRISA